MYNLYFYPRSPCGERQANLQRNQHQRKHFYPRSPCGERPGILPHHTRKIVHFYPRSPCGERRHKTPELVINIRNFYPRSPCGERRHIIDTRTQRINISIHALLAESDVEKVPADVYYQAFLSTLSLRRATARTYPIVGSAIHFYPRSPCGERPSRIISSSGITTYFYPRSPCGERP